MKQNAESVIRIMLVDDHQIVRMGLAAVLETEEDLSVVAQAGSGEEAIRLFVEFEPDVVLMDVRMPGQGGISTLKGLLQQFSQAKVIMLTTYDGDADVHRAMKSGARGYLLKSTPASEIVEAIREVHGGGRALPPQVASQLAYHITSRKLTERELEVLEYLAKGRTNCEIGAALNLTEGTVKNHMHHLFEKLGVRDRTQAVTLGLRRGLIRLD